jgi:hypothetical protein
MNRTEPVSNCEGASCSYQGYEFGAGYLDSICIDGYLWDADSCDEPGGALSHGGEMACPACNTKEYLKDALNDAKDGACGAGGYGVWCGATVWERQLRIAHKHNQKATEEFLASVEPFTTSDWEDRDAVIKHHAPWNETIERQWPWEFDIKQL